MKLSLVFVAMLHTSLFQVSNAAHPAVERACKSRMNPAFDSLYVRVFVTRDAIAPTDPLAKFMAGSSVNCQFWIGDKVERVDYEEYRPLDPRNSTTTRFARVGDVRRLVPSLKDEMILFESTDPSTDNEAFLGAISTVSIDPLKIGFWPAPFGALDKFEFSDLVQMFQENEFTEVEHRPMPDGTTIIKGEIEGGSPFWWTIAFPPDSEVPSEIVFYGRAGPHIREELKCNWIKIDELALPQLATYTRTSRQGDILWQETWRFSEHSLNESIPVDIATWEALGIWNGAAVQFLNNGSPEIKQYNDGAFQKWSPVPLFEDPGAVMRPRSSSRWLLVVNALVLGCLLVFYGLRQNKRTCDER